MDTGERQRVTGNGVEEVSGRSDRENFKYFSSVDSVQGSILAI